MLLSTSYRVAALHRQERMAESERWNRARQAAPQPPEARRQARSALASTVRFARYGLIGLTAVAVGISMN